MLDISSISLRENVNYAVITSYHIYIQKVIPRTCEKSVALEEEVERVLMKIHQERKR